MFLTNNLFHPAKISTPLILIGVLKGYINNSIFFVFTTKLTFSKFKRSIQLNLPEKFINSYGFIAWLYLRLKKKISQENAFEIIRSALLTSGLAVQQANFKNVEEKRSFKNLVKNQQLANQSGSTKLNTMSVVELSDSKYEFRVTRCVFYELFLYLNVPELTSIMCSIDNAIFNTYLPEKLTFNRNGLNRTIFDGHEFCEFVIENNEN